jgi:hypothetical protein
MRLRKRKFLLQPFARQEKETGRGRKDDGTPVMVKKKEKKRQPFFKFQLSSWIDSL